MGGVVEFGMEHVSFVYTIGMNESAVSERLRAAETGVLSLAQAGEAYGIPVHVHYDGEAVWLRLGEHEGSEKMSFVESTTDACLTVYEANDDESWSILVRGALVREGTGSPSAMNERFGPMRVFGESVSEMTPVAFRLEPAAVTGRRTSFGEVPDVTTVSSVVEDEVVGEDEVAGNSPH